MSLHPNALARPRASRRPNHRRQRCTTPESTQSRPLLRVGVRPLLAGTFDVVVLVEPFASALLLLVETCKPIEVEEDALLFTDAADPPEGGESGGFWDVKEAPSFLQEGVFSRAGGGDCFSSSSSSPASALASSSGGFVPPSSPRGGSGKASRRVDDTAGGGGGVGVAIDLRGGRPRRFFGGFVMALGGEDASGGGGGGSDGGGGGGEAMRLDCPLHSDVIFAL